MNVAAPITLQCGRNGRVSLVGRWPELTCIAPDLLAEPYISANDSTIWIYASESRAVYRRQETNYYGNVVCRLIAARGKQAPE